MDFWVIFAVAGAGSLAKYWNNRSSENGDGSYHLLSSEDSNFEKAESLSCHLSSRKETQRQEMGKDVSLDRRGLDEKSSDLSSLDGSLTGDMASKRGFNCEKVRQLRNYNESELLSVSNLAVPLSPYECDDNFKHGEDGNEQIADTFGNCGFFLPDFSANVVPIHNSFGHKTCLSTKRFPEYVSRPLISLESCFMAQEHAKTEEYVFSPLSSSCMATRSFHVSNGSRIVNRANGTLINSSIARKEHKLHKGGRAKEKNDTKKMKLGAVIGRSRRSNFSDDVLSGKFARYDPTLLFCFGISLGIIISIMGNKREIIKLRELLKQSENLVQDLQDELDMKDSLTVKELHNENYGSQETCDHSFNGKELHEFSPEKHVDSSPRIDFKESSYDKKEEQSSESMSKIEAELEAELERLGLDMNNSSLDRKLSELVEIDPDFVADFAQGELGANTFSGTDANVTTPLPANYGVSPHELSVRLHELIQHQLEKRVKELEIALENSQRRVRFLESEHDSSFEKASSPTKGNSLMTPEDCDTMSQPLILNLSGEALDAYNEAYEELIMINDSEDNSPSINIHDSDDNKEGSLSHDWNGTVFEHGSTTYSVVDEGSLSREPYFSKETMLEGESSSELNVSGDEGCDCDNDEMERQLIRQIVERTKKGSPLFQNAKKMLYSMDEDEQH